MAKRALQTRKRPEADVRMVGEHVLEAVAEALRAVLDVHGLVGVEAGAALLTPLHRGPLDALDVSIQRVGPAGSRKS